MADGEIWQIADRFVAPARGPIKARGDLNSLIVIRIGLSVALTKGPHPRHADILGWDRSKAKLQALKLAEAATLVLRAAPLVSSEP